EVGGAPVARGKQEEAGPGEVAAAIVGDVPAQPRLHDPGKLASALLHLRRRQACEGRQRIAEGADELVRLADDGVDLRPSYCASCLRASSPNARKAEAGVAVKREAVQNEMPPPPDARGI